MSKVIDLPPGIVAEMTTKFGEGTIQVPLAKGVSLKELTEGDEDPLFVTLDALSETVSGNKRLWTAQELRNVAEQVNKKKPDGYQGHLAPSERSSKAPDAVTMWLGAKVATHNGKQHLFIKGYVLPKASQFKDYLRRAAAAGKNVAVSVYGQAFEKWNENLSAYEISNFNLESIDWARPGSEGVPNSGYLKLTAEMNEGDEMDKTTILKATTVSEMQEHNPAVVQEIADNATQESQGIISEMTEALGVTDSKELPKIVSEMKARTSELETQVAHNEVDKILGNNVPNVAARSALRKMVVGELKEATESKVIQETVQKVLDSEEGKALIGAFKKPVVTPGATDNRTQASGKRFIKK